MIGLFDSGLGGLTILRELLLQLPGRDYLYLGDNAATPYGNKPSEEILNRTKLGVEFLFKQGCRLVILACNTASAQALRHLQQNFLPASYPDRRLLGIIVPTVEYVTGADWRHTHPITTPISAANLTIGILATLGTVESEAYPREIHRRNQSLRVIQQACPELATLIEQNVSREILEKESARCLTQLQSHIGTAFHAILLGCTHYDLIYDLFAKNLNPLTKLYRQPPLVAQSLTSYLHRHPRIDAPSTTPLTAYFTTGNPPVIATPAARFFGRPLDFQSVVLS